MDGLRYNINKIHIDLLLEYGEVKLEEKSNLEFGNYFEIIINEDKQLKMIVVKRDIENANFNWKYFSNPLNEKSNLVERSSNIFSLIHDVKDIFEKKRFSEEYLNELSK